MEVQEVYELAMKFGQQIWGIVAEWGWFERDTIGKQIVRSADSVAANLREGFGRYSYKERNLFYIYARGSLYETHCWLEKSYTRNLLPEPAYKDLLKDFDTLKFQINRMITTTRLQSTK